MTEDITVVAQSDGFYGDFELKGNSVKVISLRGLDEEGRFEAYDNTTGKVPAHDRLKIYYEETTDKKMANLFYVDFFHGSCEVLEAMSELCSCSDEVVNQLMSFVRSADPFGEFTVITLNKPNPWDSTAVREAVPALVCTLFGLDAVDSIIEV